VKSLTCRLRLHRMWRIGSDGWYCAGCSKKVPLWRCAIGLHYAGWWDPNSSYDEPPDPWWHCAECEVMLMAGTLRGRLISWLFETRIGEWYADWEYRRHPEYHQDS
jgi:hypothetical protein